MNRNVEEYVRFKKGEIRMPEHLKPKKEETATNKSIICTYLEAFIIFTFEVYIVTACEQNQSSLTTNHLFANRL